MTVGAGAATPTVEFGEVDEVGAGLPGAEGFALAELAAAIARLTASALRTGEGSSSTAVRTIEAEAEPTSTATSA